jgi:hypothetical protein
VPETPSTPSTNDVDARARPSPRPPSSRDRAQATALILMSIVLIATIALAISAVATRLTQRSRAQNAADAAALAGVDAGRGSASMVAGRNGAALISFESHRGSSGVIVTVEVAVGGEHAMARASSAP